MFSFRLCRAPLLFRFSANRAVRSGARLRPPALSVEVSSSSLGLGSCSRTRTPGESSSAYHTFWSSSLFCRPSPWRRSHYLLGLRVRRFRSQVCLAVSTRRRPQSHSLLVTSLPHHLRPYPSHHCGRRPGSYLTRRQDGHAQAQVSVLNDETIVVEFKYSYLTISIIDMFFAC